MKKLILSIEEYAETMMDIVGADGTQVNHMGTDSEGYQVWWAYTQEDQIVTCREKRGIYEGLPAFMVEYIVGNSVRYSLIEDTFNSTGEEI